MKFRARFKSESGDDYDVELYAPRQPQSDTEWLRALRACDDIPEDDIGEGAGPGIAGTYLHLCSIKAIR